MPFKLPQIPGTKKTETTLDDILSTHRQKADLVVLVSECAHHMRERLDGSFTKSREQVDTTRSASWEASNEIDQTAVENVQKNKNEAGWAETIGWSSNALEEFRKSALHHFDTWKENVQSRIQEAMKVESDALDHALRDYKVQFSTKSNLDSPLQNLALPKVECPPALRSLSDKDRAFILGAILFMLLSLEYYESQSRVLSAYLCDCLELPQDVLTSHELTTAKTLLEAAAKSGSDLDGEDARKQKAEEGFFGKKWKVGLATVAGAGLLAISGGLAAPVILGLAGTILSGVGLGGVVVLLGAVVNPITVAALFGALGGRMSSRAMEAYAKEVEDFKFLPIGEPQPEASQKTTTTESDGATSPLQKLRCIIGVSGWVLKENDVSSPWSVLSTVSVDAFALRYELSALINLGTTLEDLLKQTGFGWLRGKAIKFLLPQLAAAMAPVGLLKMGRFLDNPFTIAIERSDKAGKILARALMDRVQGRRPVTLVGFSMGARVVYSCLQSLADNKAYGIIEDAILIGAPAPSSENSWKKARTVVAGRMINVYSGKDVLLAYLYRFRNAQLGVAGTQSINVSSIENLDVSEFVDGHNQYCLAIGRILQKLKYADLDLDQIERENIALEKEKIYEEQFYEDAKKEGKLTDFEGENGEIIMGSANNDPHNQSSLIDQSDKRHMQQ